MREHHLCTAGGTSENVQGSSPRIIWPKRRNFPRDAQWQQQQHVIPFGFAIFCQCPWRQQCFVAPHVFCAIFSSRVWWGCRRRCLWPANSFSAWWNLPLARTKQTGVVLDILFCLWWMLAEVGSWSFLLATVNASSFKWVLLILIWQKGDRTSCLFPFVPFLQVSFSLVKVLVVLKSLRFFLELINCVFILYDLSTIILHFVPISLSPSFYFLFFICVCIYPCVCTCLCAFVYVCASGILVSLHFIVIFLFLCSHYICHFLCLVYTYVENNCIWVFVYMILNNNTKIYTLHFPTQKPDRWLYERQKAVGW